MYENDINHSLNVSDFETNGGFTLNQIKLVQNLTPEHYMDGLTEI